MTFISPVCFKHLMQRMIFIPLTHRCGKICRLLDTTRKFGGHLSDNDRVDVDDDDNNNNNNNNNNNKAPVLLLHGA